MKDVTKHVLDVEEEDPWMKSLFGISGTGTFTYALRLTLTGEGLVYYPTSEIDEKGHLHLDRFCEFAFKAKGANL